MQTERLWCVVAQQALTVLTSTVAALPKQIEARAAAAKAAAAKAATDRMAPHVKRAIFNKIASPYGITGITAGETEAVHERTLATLRRQQLVEVSGQSDVLVAGLPYVGPYNVNSIMNPILVVCLGLGYFFNMYRGRPLVRPGGLFSSTTARLPSFNWRAQISESPFFMTRSPSRPSASWSTAITSLLVRMSWISGRMARRSLPAISGAARIAHRLKCERYSTSLIPPLPTSSMSGSFQWPGPAYDCNPTC